MNEISGQITPELKEQEFSFLPVTHILISWPHSWSFIKLSCTVQELSDSTDFHKLMRTYRAIIGHTLKRRLDLHWVVLLHSDIERKAMKYSME